MDSQYLAEQSDDLLVAPVKVWRCDFCGISGWIRLTETAEDLMYAFDRHDLYWHNNPDGDCNGVNEGFVKLLDGFE